MNEQDWTATEGDVDPVGVAIVDGDMVEVDIVEVDVVEADSGDVVAEIVIADPSTIQGGSEDDETDLEDVLVLEVVDDALVLPVWEPTGVARVDEALDELTRLDPDDVHHHAEVYDTIHQRLRGTLSDLDTPV